MREKLFKSTVSLLAMFFIAIMAFSSENGEKLTPEKLFEMETVGEVSISPDQENIAFTLTVPRPFDHDPGGNYRELYVYNIETGDITELVSGDRMLSSIGWTPQSDAVTFRANMEDVDGVQIFTVDIEDRETEVLFEHDVSVRQYEFFDENTVAFTALAPEDADRKEFRDKGFDIEVYEEEWRHLNLYLKDLESGEIRQLTEGVTVFDFVVCPDGERAAAAIAPKNLVDHSYMFKRIHVVDFETGEVELIMENPGKLGTLAWSPDGEKLAFRAASKLEDSVVGSLFVIDVPTDKEFDELHNYVEGLELSVIDVGWKDNNTLLFAAEEGVDIVLSEQELDAEERTKLTQPGDIVFGSFHHVDGLVAFSGNTSSHPSELYTFGLDDSELERRSDHNPWLDDIKLSEQRMVEYNARDGKRIEGVLLYPLDYDEDESYPLITYIHGGPEAAVQDGWVTGYSTWGQFATARDYFVFMPNYRASSGRGVDYTMAGYGDLVGTEYDDVIDGIDYLIDIGYVDEDRVGMGGGSYGGYFSAWSATRHTDRFAASVVFVGISNQISKRNTTDIPYEDYHVHWGFWTHEDWEKIYDASPVKYAHQSQTPTLVLHGSDDPRVHPSQGLELYRALKLHGDAPTRLIWYNNEGHGNRINLNRYDYLVRTMQWFDHYLRLDKPKDEKPPKYLD